jgi:hypothetical protein
MPVLTPKISGLPVRKVRPNQLTPKISTNPRVEYATKLGVSTWPKGARWPAELNAPEAKAPSTGSRPEDNKSANNTGENEADALVEEEKNRRLAEAQESQVREQTERQKGKEDRPIPQPETATEAEVTPTPINEGTGGTDDSSG